MTNNKNFSPDYELPNLIDDTVQSLRFFPSQDINYLASGGWDSKLRLFEINYSIQGNSGINDIAKFTSNQITICQHKSPILSLSWKGNSGAIFTGCADGSVNYVDFQKNILTKIGEHQYGCREVIHLFNNNLLVSGGWDGILKLWDLRANEGPITSYQFFNKINTMSYSKNLLVIGLSENIISYFNLGKLQMTNFQPELIYNSHIKSQIKKVAALKGGDGYIEGNSEGKVAVKYIDCFNPQFDKDSMEIKTDKDYSFKCRREIKNNIAHAFNINDISVNPTYGSICIAEGDGRYSIFDIEQRQRLYEKKDIVDKTPLTACEYNLKGDILAYSQGYDWSKGAKFAHLYSRPRIFVHYLQKSHRKKN